MQADDSGQAPRRDGFAATRWSLVAGAAERAQASLAELCVRYWFPVYAYARRSGHPPEVAQQITLSYFHHLVTQRLAQRDAAASLDVLAGRLPGDPPWAPAPSGSFLAPCARPPGPRSGLCRGCHPPPSQFSTD